MLTSSLICLKDVVGDVLDSVVHNGVDDVFGDIVDDVAMLSIALSMTSFNFDTMSSDWTSGCRMDLVVAVLVFICTYISLNC